ncbi:hypothetical protein HPB50_009319 [Hyalomma asiaticum]|uniref:Uncharacterized protein n=1 Tax=Hyalomma asiaticum TaxID=266040 RepID=A0ACB7T785_HYAAI|nr:hypothetical protein HPB50_009319 [Hyalomma asiaticum]
MERKSRLLARQCPEIFGTVQPTTCLLCKVELSPHRVYVGLKEVELPGRQARRGGWNPTTIELAMVEFIAGTGVVALQRYLYHTSRVTSASTRPDSIIIAPGSEAARRVEAA